MINRYFDSSIHILIDEMNLLLGKGSKEEKMLYANNNFSEADFAIRIGSPFRHLARFPMQGTKGQDIIVDYLDFEVEIKYWRNWYGGTGIQKIKWENSYEKAFSWLSHEIEENKKKNKRAMVCGWFTCFEWPELLQLGLRGGPNPNVNLDRLNMLPFLKCKDRRIRTIETDYSNKHGVISLDKCEEEINWELYGEKSDVLNILMLY
jgi:hypothetical protein